MRKPSLLSLALAGALAALGACTARGGAVVTRPSHTPGVDHARMSTVEANARRRGVDVIWIHPPQLADAD